MRRFPIYVNGEIAVVRITQALTNAGFHVRCDINGLTVVDEVPGIIRHSPPSATVLPMAQQKRKKK